MKEVDGINSSLKERLNQLGITAAAFDLDDTLLQTNRPFGGWMRRFVNAVVEKSGLDWRDVWDQLIEINNSTFSTHFVRQDRLPYAARLLDEHFNSKPLFANHSDLLTAIYSFAPKMLDGAAEVLDTFLATGLPMAVVTHAEKKWTELKIKKNGLGKYFSDDRIIVADAGKFKGPDSWVEAIKKLGVPPEQVLVVGDNLKGDILAAREAGVRYTILVESPWAVYREGEVPKDVIEAKSITDVPRAIMDMA